MAKIGSGASLFHSPVLKKGSRSQCVWLTGFNANQDLVWYIATVDYPQQGLSAWIVVTADDGDLLRIG